MAKLNKDKQKQAAEAQTSNFDPIPDGTYHLRLRDVNPDGEGPAGPYWVWEFEVVGDPEHTGRRLWTNVSLSEAAAFKLKETYDAFGVTYDTDTDELLGDIVKGRVSTRTIQGGSRKGELSNQIDRLMPKDADFTLDNAPDGTKVEESIF